MTTDRTETQVKQSASSIKPFWQNLPGILAYPVRHDVLGLIAAFALARLITYKLGSAVSIQWLPDLAITGGVASVSASVLGIVLELVLLILGLKLAVEALLNTANDRLDPASRGPFWASDYSAASQLLVLLIFLVPVYLIALWFGKGPALPVLGLALLALPAAVIVLAMDEHLWHALDPRAWAQLLRRLGASYFGVVSLIGILALLVYGLQSAVLSRFPGWFEAPASRFASLYALVVAYHLMGYLLHQHHELLGLDTTPPIPRPRLANLEEDSLMQQSDTLAADGDPVAAADVLHGLIHRHGASAPVHARYRELLALTRDIARLSGHARGYVPTLLALGQAKHALALHIESRSLDPDFQLDVPEDITRLIAHAAATGQSKQAIELATGFDIRFPKNADVPQNMLVSAKLMAERLGRTTEAKVLLEGLAERYPDHALTPAIQQALAEVQRMLAIERR